MTVNELLEDYSNIRLADATDNQAIVDFYNKEAMETGDELISFDRKGDFFKFYQENSQPYWCFLFLNKDKSIGGIGTVLRQYRMIDGQERPVAYFCDLRMSPKADRIAKLQWLKFFKVFVAQMTCLKEDEYCVAAYTAILSDNSKAITALTKGGRGFKYRFLGDYEVTSFISTGVFNNTRYDLQEISNDELIEFYMENELKLFKESYDSLVHKCELYKEFPNIGVYFNGKLIAATKLVKSHSRQLKIQNMSKSKIKVLNLGKVFGVKEIPANGVLESFDMAFLSFNKSLQDRFKNDVISSIQKWIGDNDVFSNANIVNVSHDKDFYSFSKFKHGLNVSTKGKVFEIHPEDKKGVLPKEAFCFEGAFL